MSNDRRKSAVSNGRLNLEQQRKRAKELLKAAKSGDKRTLTRLSQIGVSPSQAPKLTDAQRLIAHENGFGSWARLKHHIEALAYAREHGGEEADREMPTVHVRCGSDIRQALEIAGFRGRFVEFSDPFCIGPVPPLPPEEHIRNRARFLSGALGLAEADALARLHGEYGSLATLREDERIVLWFEHDSYDQLILAYLLRHLGTARPGARIELVAVDRVPGVERFIGIGQLAPELLTWLWQRRVTVTEAQFELGSRVWDAVTAPTPGPLFDLARAGTPEIPLMGPALLRHLRELPGLRTGLGLTERLALEIARDGGPMPLGRIFAKLMREREPLPYLGDAMFEWMVLGLADGGAPLLEVEPVRTGDLRFDHSARLTPLGEQVLEGRTNRLDFAPAMRWVGGVKTPEQHGSWCWDEQAGRPVWRDR